MKKNIREVGFDPALSEGAYNAVRVCLDLKPDERMTVIADHASLEIVAALIDQVEQVGSPYRLFVLEDYTRRPLGEMPAEILADLEAAQVSVFAARPQKGELKARMQMMQVVNRRKIRHGHMVGITKAIMLQGMRADFIRVDRLSVRILEKARAARTIRARSKAGTDIEARFSPDLNWIKTSGLISPDKWGNLPGGEVFTSPYRLDGVFVVDGSVGDYLCQKYGDLKDTPLTIEIAESRIQGLTCENQALVQDFDGYTRTDENSNRVGEFAIGTNLAVKDIIGNMLQDEKIPGIHIAFGHPYNEHTGQTWNSTTHIDCVGRDFDIWIDDELVMKDGRFLVEVV